MGRPFTPIYAINLVPFHNILRGVRNLGRLSWDAFGNMVMFVPLGIFFCYYAKKYGRAIVGCVLATVGIELCQYLLKTGTVDVDDVILNTLGGMIGIVLFACIAAVCKKGNASTKDVVATCASAFPPFLLFYLADTFFSTSAYRYQFVAWHAVPVALYFVPIYFVLLRRLTRLQKLGYVAMTLAFAVYFFGAFLP